MYAAGTSPQYAASHPDTWSVGGAPKMAVEPFPMPTKFTNPGDPPGWKYPSNVPQRPPQGSAFPPAPAAPAPQQQSGDDISSWLSTLKPEDMSFLRQLIAAVREAQGRDAKQAQQPPAPGMSPPVANAPALRKSPEANTPRPFQPRVIG